MNDQGVCLCPGERIFNCQRLDPPSCVSACSSLVELCQVMKVRLDDEVEPEELRWCEDEDEDEDEGESESESEERGTGSCFEITPQFGDCSATEAFVEVPGLEDGYSLVVNCPPPASDDSAFDCPPDGSR